MSLFLSDEKFCKCPLWLATLNHNGMVCTARVKKNDFCLIKVVIIKVSKEEKNVLIFHSKLNFDQQRYSDTVLSSLVSSLMFKNTPTNITGIAHISGLLVLLLQSLQLSWLVLVNLTQTWHKVTLEEGTSIEVFLLSNVPVEEVCGAFSWSLVDAGGPAHNGQYCTWEGGPGLYTKATWMAMGSRPGSSTPLWSLLLSSWFLALELSFA